MTFGSTVPDESHQCLLDALWNASTAKQKHTALNALNFYFSKILEKPLSQNFSFYVLFRGERPGIYINYPELVKAIGNSSRPFWQGFYSFQEAWNQATASLPPPIFVEGNFSISEDFKELPFGEALNEEIRKQQKYGTIFVKVQSQIPYYRKGKYRQIFHHFLVTPLIEQTEEGLTEPQCDKFLRDAHLYESLGNKYAEDYNSLSFDTVVKKSCYQVWIPKDCERLSLVQAGVLDPNPENYGDDGMFDDEYMADMIKV
ncbi:hypothetical protein K1719_043096 [Acacia pycnantha]|nr:hypothetical protein K1719_043096 [Acacia pycnantha]